MTHQSVLRQEAIDGLAIKPEGIYIDGTFGRGGHARLILDALNEHGRLIAIDKDPDAVAYAQAQFGDDPRFTMVHASFSDMAMWAKKLGVAGNVQGILLDLGVSSPQLDMASRGFSFMREGPLDMRMDTTQHEDAARFIATASKEDMMHVFRTYGEERYAGRIAQHIIDAREKTPITTTSMLAEIVKQAHPKWEKHKHPATRVFQAIRIHINQELTALMEGLVQAQEILAVGGRLVVISFHSLEDRRVKQFMRKEEEGTQPPIGVPIKAADIVKRWKRIGKAIKPREDELRDNVRSRSAVLRIGEKLA